MSDGPQHGRAADEDRADPTRILIPRTDLRVSRLCLGGVKLGGQLDRDASFALLDAFAAQGGRFIDTAHVYSDWLPEVGPSCSERMIGAWRRAGAAPADMVVATKIGHPLLSDMTRPRLDRAALRADVQECLAALHVDALDLVYLHRDDPSRPVADLLGPLEEMRRDGSIRHYGVSNWSADRIAAAWDTGWDRIAANQPEWNLAQRNPGTAAGDMLRMDAAMFHLHARTGLAAVPYSTQAKGYFDKRAAGTLDARTAAMFDNATSAQTAMRLATQAARFGVSLSAVALAMLLRAPFPTIPVIGAGTPAQVAAGMRALAIAAELEESEGLLF
jgi:aryl-alcohol dehydrogenase-like predicted oxidoreductase